ncbi:MAG: Oxygen-dependent coproporphyrinogen-III oxidase [Chroococcopsis gigantea SAG 12.99]|jgi:coproporphyrinogen III oxidase|nr:oxygen-dependent coproporphyrinogen oxidase [Chlorogloea purpurea SAG 13.99]MDV3001253.1 Oxygen-dependent coproporphyrinogen-III oxidase [Chroococcopsis gigantea SAG 12.99]
MTSFTTAETSSSSLPPGDSRTRVSAFMKSLQDEICTGLTAIDGEKPFREDSWQREEGGGGRSRVLREGNIFEQGGVNFSEVWGDQLPPSILKQRPEAAGHGFYATGTSMVLHPRNPYIPTVHLNYRYFEAGPVWWFGGGADLTPYYGFTEDATHFHKSFKETCDKYHPEYYEVFKRWCDEYFYLNHRGETRGVGGIFFDYQDGLDPLYRGPYPESSAAIYSEKLPPQSPRNWEDIFGFISDCGRTFLNAYVPIVQRRHQTPYGDRERQFQLYRRGRYVEFNLVYDRGTIFGLQTNGRTESILMSLPPLVRWEYDYHPEPNTQESRLYEVFLKPQDWLNWPEKA